uniref:PA domain-containing protein n=1 Tax=Brassica campestris TaxID=3711 RepID=M4F9H4_BRACM
MLSLCSTVSPLQLPTTPLLLAAPISSYFTGFGASLPSKARQSRRLHAFLVDPPDSCYILSSRMDAFAVSFRGNCEKAKHAEAAGASALLVINDKEDPDEMVCVEKDMSLNVTIPVLMISKSSGYALYKSMLENKSDPDQANESYSISSKVNHLVWCCVLYSNSLRFSAAAFLLHVIMDMHKIIMAVLLRKWRHLGRKTVKLPLIGTVSWMSVLVIIICLAFTVFWFVKRHTYYSWVGQDILGICLMITSLQVVRLPNIKVATVLLCCAFVYDIFWVFISPLIFHESVMIVVAQGDRSSGESMPMFLRIPRFFDPWGYDKFKKRVVSSGYFLCLTIGYGVGLLLTCLGLYLMDGHGQPALLYIVPCTLGLAVVMGLVRGELKELWNYGIEATESYTPEDPLPVA